MRTVPLTVLLPSRLATSVLLAAVATGCYRPADNYDVHLYSEGMSLDQVQPPSEPMGGAIEYARLRFWGTNLGTGLTGLWGDSPRSDGTSITMGYGMVAYPQDPAFDKVSSILSPGPRIAADQDGCITRITTSGYYGFYEYIDLGDNVTLTGPDGDRIVLPRDPSTHHRPAGESWYVGYGGNLQPDLTDHALLPDTWRGGETWAMSFPGTIVPPDSTLGAVPYPLADAPVRFPPSLEGAALDGVAIRAPHHGYDDAGTWTGEPDDVRFPGPWSAPVTVTWTPSPTFDPVTLTIRYLGTESEGECGCSGCSDGFVCEDGQCVGEEGSGLVIEGEIVCTLADDGEFVFEPGYLDTLETWVDPTRVRGYVLGIGRMTEGTAEVPDALTYTGKRVSITPIRTRVMDLLYTRLEAK